MSYGACDHCGCSHHECECSPLKEVHEAGIWRDLLGDIAALDSNQENTQHMKKQIIMDEIDKTVPQLPIEHQPRIEKIREFTCHGTYINDFSCFEMERKLGLDEAFLLLTASVWVKEKPVSRADCYHPDYFLHNKGWSIIFVDRGLGVVKAVYNHDGAYSLRVASVQSFLDSTSAMASWHRAIRNLRTELMAPHEHA